MSKLENDIERFIVEAGDQETGDGLFDFNFKKTTQTKNIKAIPREIKKVLDTISYDKKNDIPFGSWIYKSQQYPGDIDLIEIEERCCDRKEATKKFVKITQSIVDNIVKTRKFYVGDIKAGLDIAFLIDIGKINYSSDGSYKIVGYYVNEIRITLKYLFAEKFLNEKEYKHLLSLVPDKIDQISHEKLFEALRDKWLLRWTVKEIKQGYKMLAPKRKFTLAEAINQPTMTKIDMWTNLNEKFIEVSNVLVFIMKDKKGNKQVLNFTNATFDYVKGLKAEIQKLIFSHKNFKPFKAVKRMWAIARNIKDENMVKKLTPVMQSDLGRLSQISSELETLILILEGVRTPPMASILKQLDNMKYRLQNVYEVDIDNNELIKIFDKLVSRKLKKATLIKNLEDLKKYFKKVIGDATIKELQYIGLWPIPASYLPVPSGSGFFFDEGLDRKKIFKDKRMAFGNALSDIPKTIYKKVANLYRRNFCNGKARPLEQGELHPLCANYEGPGTRIDLHPNTPPFNNIDNCARTHDFEYRELKKEKDIGKRNLLVQKADAKAIECFNQFKNEEPYYSLGKAGLTGKLGVDKLLSVLAGKPIALYGGKRKKYNKK